MTGVLGVGTPLAEAERLVDSALIENVTASEWLEQRLAASRKPGGRSGGLRVRTLLVALQLGAFVGDYFLSSVVERLNSLGPKDRARLGLARTGRAVTYRQVCYLVTRIDEVLRRDFVRSEGGRIVDGYRDFDLLFNALATTGAHPDTATVKSIALDGSDIPSWGADRLRHEVVWEVDEKGRSRIARDEEGNARYERVRVVSDIDAGYRGSRAVEGKREHFGYCLTVAITVREEEGPDVPRAAVAARLRPTLVQDREMGLAVIGEVAQRRGGLGDVLMDRGYTPALDGKDFVLPIRAMGGEPIFSLTKYQLGPAGTVRGAVIIEGRPYSPSIPRKLMKIVPPRGVDGAYTPHPVELREYQDQIAAREVYALVPHGTRRANGTQVFQCPGAAGKLECPLQPARRGLREGALPVLRVPTNPGPESVCVKAFPSFTLEDLPLMQRHVFGSREWQRSYARRSSSVETFFANVKDASREGVWRGRIRVTGIIKTGLCVALAVASANRRLALAFSPERAVERPRRRRPGRPTHHRRLTYRQVIEDAAASRVLLRT